jgi:hypothetical protein
MDPRTTTRSVRFGEFELDHSGELHSGDRKIKLQEQPSQWAYVCKSLDEQAIAAGRKATELSQGAPTFLFGLAQAYAGPGRRNEALTILQQLHDLSQKQYVTPYGLARVYTALDQKEEAICLLHAAYEQNATWMIFMKTDPHLDALRTDPRFQDLLQRMSFPID